MVALTTQCPCAQRMRLPPRLEGESKPGNGELVVCAYCERVGRASVDDELAQVLTDAEVRALPTRDKQALDSLRDQAHERFPKRRRRPVARAVAAPR